MLIVFDLDGTLIDSEKDLCISANAARGHFGLPPLEPAVIRSYVGNGAAVLIRKAMGPDAPLTQVDEALAFFLRYYRAHALEHTRLYPGIQELVTQLAADRHKLAILTNKPVRISADIVAALKLAPHFVRVYGGDSFPQKKPDPTGLLKLVEETYSKLEDTWMVGDSGVDVDTAHNAGTKSCGVTWGFHPEACAASAPDAMIGEPHEFLALL